MSGLLMLLHWVFVPIVVEGTEQCQMMHTGQPGHWQQESVSSAGFFQKAQQRIAHKSIGKRLLCLVRVFALWERAPGVRSASFKDRCTGQSDRCEK